jgi:hypothetical protein
VLADKRVLCFGVCGERCQPPSGAFDEVALGSGGEACALSYPGTVKCWGFGAPFHASPPATVALHGLTVGERFACALDADGRPVCWGDRTPALPEPPPLRGVRLLAADRTHVCAIDESSEIVCWGLFPLTPPHGRFIHLGGRWEQFCGVREGGTASCFGELKGRKLVPSQHYGSNLRTVAVGQNHFCGVSPQGKLDCWEEVMRFGEGILPASGRIIEPTPEQEGGPSLTLDEPLALATRDAGRPAPEPTLPSTPPADKPFSLSIDGTPLKIAGAVARTGRGSPAIEMVLSDHPLACSAFAPGWQSVTKEEHRVSLTLSSLLLEPMSDGTYSRPRTSPLRVRHVSWPALGQELGGGLKVSASGIAAVDDLDAMRAGRPTRVHIANESTFGPVGKSPATTLRMEGSLGVTSCAPSIPTAQRRRSSIWSS